MGCKEMSSLGTGLALLADQTGTPPAATGRRAANPKSFGREVMIIMNTGDTAWVLMSSVLVLGMTIPGLAFFYGGLVRRKNVLSIW